jgi:hypothetical protein
MTLFFVMIAFFAASTLLVRSHYEAQATIMDTVSIQREALARSALASGQAMLESAGTDEVFEKFSLAGPGGLEAHVWLVKESDDLFRMYAEVKGGMGRPYLAQKVLRKKPRLSAIDMVHLVDGDLTTADQLKYRVVGSKDWVSLPNSKSSMMWVEVDRRGNVVSNYFPVLETGKSPNLPDGFIERLVAKNDELINQGKIEHGFFKKASLAIEENWELNINKAIEVGVNAGNSGFAPGAGNSSFAPEAGNGPAANVGVGNPGGVLLENDPDLIRPARMVADALTQGAAIEHYSQDSGKWMTVELDLSREPSGGIPGPATSDGKGLYFPILKPGPDSIRRYDFRTEGWSEVAPPPAFSGGGKTKHLLDVEVDDDGRIYAHHGDDGQYGLSMFDPDTDSWAKLPSPKGIYVEKSGKSATLTDSPSDWGNLEVDDQGNVYVIWRSKSATEVVNHLASSGSGIGGGFVGSGGGVAPPPPKPDKETLPGGGFMSPSDGFKSFGQPKLNAGAGSQPAPSPYGGSAIGGGSKPTMTGGGTSQKPGGPVPSGNAGNAGNAENIGTTGFTTGFPPFSRSELPSDMILKLSDGKWTAIRPPLNPGQTLGNITAGTDGRLLLHVVTPTADQLVSIKPDGTVEPPSFVPGEGGKSALYFGVDSGAQTIPGKYTFQETADF